MASEWGLRQQVTNGRRLLGRRVTDCEIAVTVRVQWRQRPEELVDAIATGWSGQFVRVQLEQGVLWVDAGDVGRR